MAEMTPLEKMIWEAGKSLVANPEWIVDIVRHEVSKFLDSAQPEAPKQDRGSPATAMVHIDQGDWDAWLGRLATHVDRRTRQVKPDLWASKITPLDTHEVMASIRQGNHDGFLELIRTAANDRYHAMGMNLYWEESTR